MWVNPFQKQSPITIFIGGMFTIAKWVVYGIVLATLHHITTSFSHPFPIIFPYAPHFNALFVYARRETNVGKLAGSITRRLRNENVALVRD